MNDKLLCLAKRYDVVIGDTFELFYRGVIRSMNPYKYYIYVTSKKGRPFPRYYTYTPVDGDEGDYELSISLYDDYHTLIETASTTLHVVKAVAPKKIPTILCFGDSLTVNGVWPYEAYRRFTKRDDNIYSNNFGNVLNMVGTMKKEEVGFEGYGGWQWCHFCNNEATTMSSSVWVDVESHNLDENDQHSIWKSNNLLWVLETISENRLKFKRGNQNFSCMPTISNLFTNVEGGVHKDDIIITKYEFECGNPFYSEQIKGPSFKQYCMKNNFNDLDYVYILLTWNGQYKPFNKDFSHFEGYITTILNTIHEEFPLCKVRLLGIQSPSISGGIASNYGASGLYSDVFGEVSTAYNYDMYLESLCERVEYMDFVRYIDTKAQFDVEHSMPEIDTLVNRRSTKTERIGTNGVHPTMEGYLQISDAFYRALCADMCDLNNNED